jgi:hypothetical protein
LDYNPRVLTHASDDDDDDFLCRTRTVYKTLVDSDVVGATNEIKTLALFPSLSEYKLEPSASMKILNDHHPCEFLSQMLLVDNRRFDK